MLRARSLLFFALVGSLSFAGYAAGCGGDGGSEFPAANADGGDGATGDDTSFGFDGQINLDSGPQQGAPITIVPANPVVDVTITNGVVAAAPLTFTAVLTNGGVKVPASFTLDRGELGTLAAATGVFTASGHVGGQGQVTAQYQGQQATTKVTVHIKSTQNGAPSDYDAGGGAGGNGGVGGAPLGGSVDDPNVRGLISTTNNPVPASDLSILYPYAGTVWPRGMLPPLMQWQTTESTAKYVWIHLKEDNFEFEGFYAGASLVNQPIEAGAWKQATNSNAGEALHVDMKIADDSNVWGPVSQDWLVAPGVLKGTVYYNSYNSQLNGGGGTVTGAVLAIKPGDIAPTLAVPSLQGHCHVCHEVAADGKTLFTNDNTQLGGADFGYGFGASYDLTQDAGVIKQYYPDAGGLPDDQLIGKYTYSGVYPDGTMAVASSQENYHSYQHASDLFSRDTMLAVQTTGLTDVVGRAVTPSFSPDGRRLAFNYWTAPSGVDAGVAPGNGHTIAALDFACGATTGSVTCATPPYAFSGLRSVMNDPLNLLGWPSFFPDGSAVIVQRTTQGSGGGSPLNTYLGGKADLWIANVPAAGAQPAYAPQSLCAVNGFQQDCTTSYLPTNANHADDSQFNYEPTVNPIASGGYYWVVFTTRRMYGNVAAGDPYEGNSYSPITHPITKKLWVAAVDINPQPGKDPSHPAFYLPGQELNAGNMRGFWAVDPCHANGTTCETGDECCNGFCRQPDDGGALICTDKPQGCAQEFEKCVTTNDCCGNLSGYSCVNGRCALDTPR